MFFILSKVLLFIIKPLIWIIVLFLWGMLTKKAKRKKRLLWSAFAALLFFSHTVIAVEWVRLWEIHGTSWQRTDNYDCGVLLGGMSHWNGDLQRLDLLDQGDRIWQTLNLYHKGKIKRILISGDDGSLVDKGLNEAEQMKEILVEWGIPAAHVWVEARSRNTHENARETATLLKRSHPEVQKVLLITSGFHMRRAVACFQKEGMQVTPFSTDLMTGAKRKYYWQQFLWPDASNFEKWEIILKEMIGYVVYDAVGYI